MVSKFKCEACITVTCRCELERKDHEPIDVPTGCIYGGDNKDWVRDDDETEKCEFHMLFDLCTLDPKCERYCGCEPCTDKVDNDIGFYAAMSARKKNNMPVGKECEGCGVEMPPSDRSDLWYCSKCGVVQ